MWTGHPNGRTIPIYAEKWGIEPTGEAIFQFLKDDCRWITADGGYRHPDGLPAIDPSYKTERRTLSAGGFFADAETLEDVEKYPWPDPDYCIRVIVREFNVTADVSENSQRGFSGVG